MRIAIHTWLRVHLSTLIGGSLLILAVDGCVLIFRLIGLSRETALYAGLFTFVLLGTIIACVAFRPQRSEGKDHKEMKKAQQAITQDDKLPPLSEATKPSELLPTRDTEK